MRIEFEAFKDIWGARGSVPIDFRVEVQFMREPHRIIYDVAGETRGSFVWIADQRVSLRVVMETYIIRPVLVRVTYTRFPELLGPFYRFPDLPLFLVGLAVGLVVCVFGLELTYVLYLTKSDFKHRLRQQETANLYRNALDIWRRLQSDGTVIIPVFGTRIILGSEWILVFTGLLTYFILFRNAFGAFALWVGSSLLVDFHVKIRKWTALNSNLDGKTPAYFQSFFQRCDVFPSIPFILGFVFFLIMAAVSHTMDMLTDVTDLFAVNAYYLLVIGVGVQLASTLKWDPS